MKQHPKWVEFLREQYPPGTRIRLREMKDPYTTGKHGGVYMLFTPVGRLYLKRKIDKRLARQTQKTEE